MKPYIIHLVKKEGKYYLKDNIRKKEIVFTPEEEVRQNFIKQCIEKLHYPLELFNVEKKVTGLSITKRFDIIIYKNRSPWMLVECKAPSIAITKDSLLQILSYNKTIKAPYIVLTNGSETFCLKIDGEHSQWLTQLPTFYD